MYNLLQLVPLSYRQCKLVVRIVAFDFLKQSINLITGFSEEFGIRGILE